MKVKIKPIISRGPCNALRQDLYHYMYVCYISTDGLMCTWGCPQQKKKKKKNTPRSTVQSLRERPTKLFGNTPRIKGTFGDKYQVCSSRILQLPKILPRNRNWHSKIHHFGLLHSGSIFQFSDMVNSSFLSVS